MMTISRPRSGIQTTLTFSLISLVAMLVVGGQLVEASDALEYSLEIKELGATIVATDDGPRVKDVSPVSWRLEKYQNVNLQAGDLVFTAGGTRIHDLAALRNVVETANAGDEIMLGLQRFERLAVAKYIKATEVELAMVAEAAETAREAKAAKSASKGCTPQIKLVGGEGVTAWADLAVILEDVGGQVFVKDEIDMPSSIGDEVELTAGDRINALQDVELSSAEQLLSVYDGIEIGATVSLAISRHGERSVVSFEKPEPSASCVQIRR
jgi:S1-C subfamily serine protease